MIDSNSTHSYVLNGLASELGIVVETIEKGVTVTSLFRDSVLVYRVYCKCPQEVQGQVLYANLTELSFFGFDVIIGMDWLTKHKAKIDF